MAVFLTRSGMPKSHRVYQNLVSLVLVMKQIQANIYASDNVSLNLRPDPYLDSDPYSRLLFRFGSGPSV